MARYIDAEALTDHMLERYDDLCEKHGDYDHYTTGYGDAIDAIENAPTADVVPKSEVVSILDGLMEEAREISNRYEKSANETSDYDYARIEYRGCQMGALIVLFKIAELKKKYTEEKKDDNQN
jgi:hypothetical protein